MSLTMSTKSELGRRSLFEEKMAESVALSLPSLTRYRGVPRRYEETRPVFIQGKAHQKIIGIGHDLHRKTLDMAELEKLKSVRDAEKLVWAEAEQIKAVAIQKALEEASADNDRLIKKINKLHDKALKEEALRVEMAMQKLAIEQVKQARVEGEERLREAVRKTEEKGRVELKAAVEAARKEEQTSAFQEAARVKIVHQDILDKAIKKAAEEKAKALKDLQEAKAKERLVAVAAAEDRERKIAIEKVEKITKEYEKQIEQLKEEIKGKNAEIKKRDVKISEVELAKKKVEASLKEVQVDFQDFIDRIQCFENTKGQADYTVRSVYVDEIGKIAPINMMKLHIK